MGGTCPTTSLAASPVACGSRWHCPTLAQEIRRIADKLESGRHTSQFRRALPPRNVPQPDVCHAARLAFRTRAHTRTVHLLPQRSAPRTGEVDGIAQRKIKQPSATQTNWRLAAIPLHPAAHSLRAMYPNQLPPHGRFSIPNPRSKSHSSSTSLAASPAAWGSRWHHPTRDQNIRRIADELETGHHTVRSRRAMPPRNVSQPDACHTAGLAFRARTHTHTVHLLPQRAAP